MEITAQSLLDSFKYAYANYMDSIAEADEVVNMYHNRQYTPEQLETLTSRGQPAETFNIIKLFTRMTIGYYSTVITKMRAKPSDFDDISTATLLSDAMSYVLRDNQFDLIGDNIKVNALLTGLFTIYYNVEKTGKFDKYGRPKHRIVMEYVNPNELIRDPMSRKADYSDARFTHRFKWISKEKAIELFGDKIVQDKMTPFINLTTMPQADYTYLYPQYFNGLFTQFNNYLIVHSLVKDAKGYWWSIMWHNNTILSKEKVPYNDGVLPYRTMTLYDSNKAEHYGIFREVVESQKAINQALLQIQLLVNSNRVFVQDGAVDDIDEFTTSFNRVNGVIEVADLAGIKIENLSADIQQQYVIIDKSLDRIQRVLGINDSFLGMAYASDSGAKVQLQQKATIVALRYLTSRMEQFYKFIGQDLAKLIRQYYTASEVLRITDDVVGERWIELNKPITRLNQQGQEVPLVIPVANGEGEDEYEKRILNYAHTSFEFSDMEIEIETIQYDDSDEKNAMFTQQLMEGATGQLVAQINPSGYLKMTSLIVKESKLKYSPEIVDVLEQTAQLVAQQQQQAQMQQQMMAQQAQMQQPQQLPR